MVDDLEKMKMLAQLDDAAWNSTHVMLGKRNRRSKLPTLLQLATLPLHVKPVQHMHLEVVYQLMTLEAAERVRVLLATLDFDERAPATVPPKCFMAPMAHVERLIAADVGEKIGSIDSVDLSKCNLLKYFTVVEEKLHGDRLRPITWPELLLLLSTYISEHKLKNVFEYRQLALTGHKAATEDLQASFHQVLLGPKSNLVMIAEDGSVIRMKRMPYGADAASEIMHIIVSTLAGDPVYAKPVEGLSSYSYSRCNAVHIDNVFFGGPDADVRHHYFLEQCSKARVQLNVEPGNAFLHEQTFVGMQLNTLSGTVALKKGYGDKIDIENLKTNEDFERVMGKVLYAGAVLAVRWRDYIFLLKQYRRILSQCGRAADGWTEPCKLWASARKQLEDLVGIIRNNTPVKVLDSVKMSDSDEPDAIVATDATPTSFGGVLMRRGHLPLAFGSHFNIDGKRPLEINFAEGTAALCMLTRFKEELRGKKVLVLIDNTSAMSRLARAATGRVSEWTNSPEFTQLQAEYGMGLRLQYINTKCNPADAPSRFMPLSMSLVNNVMERAWGHRQARIDRRARGWQEAAAVR